MSEPERVAAAPTSQDQQAVETLKLTVEVWKKTVDVQQHFNDLSLRIRNFALTLLVGVIGAAAVAYKDVTTSVPIAGVRMPLASAILLAGAFGWIAFYILDRHWYHRLLIGSVQHGKAVEDALAHALPVGLTGVIEAASHLRQTGPPAQLFFSGVLGVTSAFGLYVLCVLADLQCPSLALVLHSSGLTLLVWPLLPSKLEIKARHRIDAFYGLVFLVLLFLAQSLREGAKTQG